MAETAQKLDIRPVKRAVDNESDDPYVVLPPYEIGQAPSGWRVAVVDAMEDRMKAAGLIKPDASESKECLGKIVWAGLNALDYMFSHGGKIGDVVVWSYYAAVNHEWKVKDEKGKVKTMEVSYININDIIANVSHAERINAGKVKIRRGRLPNGQVQHYIEEQ